MSRLPTDFAQRNTVHTRGRVNPVQITGSPKAPFRATDRTAGMPQRGFGLFGERATRHR